MTKRGSIRIGISGWTYKPWRGTFYPNDLAHKRELFYASRRFDTIEINGTFYGLQRPSAFQRWRDETPDDFIFSVKGSRYITHMLRLKNIDTALGNFIASGILALGDKLGPILWQCPPTLKFDPDLFDRFLALLPKTANQAAGFARRHHDSRVEGRNFLDVDHARPLRHALEIRHDSFRSEHFVELLREHGVGLVCADTVEWPLLMDLTTDFVYCRLHGSKELYVSGYEEDALAVWSDRIKAWSLGNEPADAERIASSAPRSAKGRDVFVYFDNDVKVRAPADAASLAMRLDVAASRPDHDLSKPSKTVHGPSFEARRHWPPVRLRQ